MIAETHKIIPLLIATNFGTSGETMESFKMLGDKATVILTFGAIVGNAVLKVYSGATDAAVSSLMPFRYAVAGGTIKAASADYLGAWSTATASSGITLTAATYTSKMAILEIDADDMDKANNEEWLTITLSSAASSGILHAVAIVENPRYAGNRSATLLA
ncbi:MAG: hypothetical protein ABIH23_08055 [bacterium]